MDTSPFFMPIFKFRKEDFTMKELMKCTNCGEILEIEAMHEVDGNYYCGDCFNELIVLCSAVLCLSLVMYTRFYIKVLCDK